MKHLDYWIKQQKQQQLEDQIRAEQARTEVQAIVQALIEKFSIKKVILFGSLVRGKFNQNSDIDLAVEGVPTRDYFTAVAIANTLTSRWVDLKPLEDLEPHFRERVLATGECVYEANVNK
ncbi:MAG TPA: nucleotidyltransferase domain-containing protein [Candidatus Obscuribacterales bacterium]